MPGTEVREHHGGDVSREFFEREVVPAARPAVFRGLLSRWPIVGAAGEGPQALRNYLSRFDAGHTVKAKVAPADVCGRFFYNRDLTGFNFEIQETQIPAAIDTLVSLASDAAPTAFAVQSIRTRAHLPGFERENAMPLLPEDAQPRLWMGNAVTVAAHFDTSDNLACVVAGHRRFTLFPPQAVANLYSGPFELTPAGPPVSMVDFDAPDHARYPRFADALASASAVDLQPGDVLYVPYLWWHHVRSRGSINVLVNYWWNAPAAVHGDPMAALQWSMLAIKNLSEPQRTAWRALFDYYVFQQDGAPGAHLPPERRGVQGDLTTDQAQALAGTLSPAAAPARDLARAMRELRKAALSRSR